MQRTMCFNSFAMGIWAQKLSDLSSRNSNLKSFLNCLSRHVCHNKCVETKQQFGESWQNGKMQIGVGVGGNSIVCLSHQEAFVTSCIQCRIFDHQIVASNCRSKQRCQEKVSKPERSINLWNKNSCPSFRFRIKTSPSSRKWIKNLLTTSGQFWFIMNGVETWPWSPSAWTLSETKNVNAKLLKFSW